jgi:uncharacterized spore protein YtfJ
MDVQQILVGSQEALSARRVFGEPIQVDGMTVIPAASVRGGGGGGGKNGSEGGVGYGLNARPAGVFALKDGKVEWRPAVDVNRLALGGQIVGLAAILMLAPLIGRWMSRKNTQPG